MKQQLNEIKRLQKLASIKINESVLSVSDLDYEPIEYADYEPIRTVIDRIGVALELEPENLKKAKVKVYTDTSFKVMDIPNQSIKGFSVSLSDDRSEYIVNPLDSAQIKMPNTAFEDSSLKEFKIKSISTYLLTEMQTDGLERELEKLGKEIASNIEKEESIDESAIAIGISAIFAIPAVIESIGSFIKLVSKVFGLKKGQNAGDKIIDIGHKTESLFTKPIQFVLIKAGVDKVKAKETAHLLHKSTILILLLVSGLGLAKAIKAANLSTATAEGILTAIKGTEIAKYIAAGTGVSKM